MPDSDVIDHMFDRDPSRSGSISFQAGKVGCHSSVPVVDMRKNGNAARVTGGTELRFDSRISMSLFSKPFTVVGKGSVVCSSYKSAGSMGPHSE